MTQSTPLLFLTTILFGGTTGQSRPTDAAPDTTPAPDQSRRVIVDALRNIEPLITTFLANPITPAVCFDFERQLVAALRTLGREIIQVVYQSAAAQIDAASDRVRHEREDYRRLKTPTPNHTVATLFGAMTLQRHLYRCVRHDAGESSIAPAEMALGLCCGTTPAFAEAATRLLAEAGATQAAVLDRLKERHDVALGAERLRKLAAERAAALAESQTEHLANRLLALLKQADESRGRHKPVLSVGRDGVTLRDYRYRFFECAGVATLAVFDRGKKRLGTVYLGCVPEPNQTTLTARLTEVITEVLRRWDGPPPRLCYVTDAGEHETQYYRNVLRPMFHPRTGQRLTWTRVVDFYHAMERVWKMADLLFGPDTREGSAWARRMGKLLKKPNGPFRVLHAAAAQRARRTMSKAKRAEFQTAYNYLRKRTRWMQYHQYARHGIPLGSGITEAACKTLVAQRLKLSGMRWTKAGAQVILDLRAALLSGTWEEANRHLLAGRPQPMRRSPAERTAKSLQIAA